MIAVSNERAVDVVNPITFVAFDLSVVHIDASSDAAAITRDDVAAVECFFCQTSKTR